MGLNEFAGYFAVARQRARDRLHRRALRAAPRAVLPRRRLRRDRPARSRRSSCARRSTTSRPRSKLHGELPPEGVPTQREVFWRTIAARQEPLERQPGRPRQQPERRHGVGPLPALLRRGRAWTSRRSARSPRSTRRPGASRSSFTGAWSDRVGRKWLIASGMWVQAVGIARRRARGRLRRLRDRARRCSASAPRWSTRRCSRRSATSRIRRGARRRSASTGSGAISATRSARCSPASSPTRSACPPRCG